MVGGPGGGGSSAPAELVEFAAIGLWGCVAGARDTAVRFGGVE